MKRRDFALSLRVVGARLVDAVGVTKWRKRVVRRLELVRGYLVVQCCYCDCTWRAKIGANGKCKPGWRRCPAGCNRHRLAKG